MSARRVNTHRAGFLQVRRFRMHTRTKYITPSSPGRLGSIEMSTCDEAAMTLTLSWCTTSARPSMHKPHEWRPGKQTGQVSSPLRPARPGRRAAIVEAAKESAGVKCDGGISREIRRGCRHPCLDGLAASWVSPRALRFPGPILEIRTGILLSPCCFSSRRLMRARLVQLLQTNKGGGGVSVSSLLKCGKRQLAAQQRQQPQLG